MGQELFKMPHGMRTRWASPENPNAEKGKGGMELYGHKRRANASLPPGDTLVLAYKPEGTSGTIRRIWITIREKNKAM